VDEAVEAAFAESRIVAWKADDRFGFTFGAIHGLVSLVNLVCLVYLVWTKSTKQTKQTK
jgi:hypothetical protein